MTDAPLDPDRLDLDLSWLDGPTLREFYPRFGEKLLVPLEDDCIRVQWRKALAPEEYQRIAAFLRDYPDMPVHVYFHDGEPFDLAWLAHFPDVRHLGLHVRHLDSLAGLEHVTDLRGLEIGDTHGKPLDLSILSRFPRLERLHLTGHSKNIAVIEQFEGMRDLMLRSVKVHDLELLTGMRELRRLDIKLGGMRDISLLPRFEHLEYLEIWRTRGLTDVSAIGAVPSLDAFFLQAMRSVKELPDMAALTKLRHAGLMTMRGITDLTPIASAPNLKSLHVHDTDSIEVGAFRAFVGHPTLRELNLGIGVAKGTAVFEMLGLDPS